MNWSPAIRELLAVHEVFRRLGYSADHLYVDLFEKGCGHPPPCKHPHVQFALRIGGPEAEPLFRIDINEDCSDVGENWPKAVEWWNSPERKCAEHAEIYDASFAVKNKVQLISALQGRGLM